MIPNKHIKRIFLAVPAPPSTPSLCEELKSSIPLYSSLKWMRVQNLHLTICFIGNIDSACYPEIVSECKAIITSVGAFRLKFDEIAHMPSVKPRMVWARYQPAEEFTFLYHQLHKRLSPFMKGQSDVYPVPTPHITLARYHGLKPDENIKIPVGLLLPDIDIAVVTIWETISNNGQSDYAQTKDAFHLKTY